MRHPITLCAFLLPTLVLSSTAFAYEEESEEGYFQLRGSAGVTWVSPHDTNLGVTATETDTVKFNDESTGIVSLGVGYVFPLACEDECEDDDLIWFPSITPSIDGAYQFETHFSGNIWLYQDPNMSLFTNDSKISNFNLLFDVTLDVAQWERWSVFAIGGIGAAWNKVTYKAVPNEGVSADPVQLTSNTTSAFAWQGGGGIAFAAMPQLDVTLTYLYTDLGHANTSNTTSTDTGLDITAAQFDLHQQSLLLGLEWNFI